MEARSGAILDASLDAILIIDTRGTLLEFNLAAEAIFGYRAQDVIGRNLAELIIPARLREAHLQGVRAYHVTGNASVAGLRREITATRADGSEFPAELAVSRVDHDGAPAFVGFLRDLSDAKRAEGLRNLQHRVTRILADAQDLGEAISQVLKAVCREFDWSVANLWMMTAGTTLHCAHSWRKRDSALAPFRRRRAPHSNWW